MSTLAIRFDAAADRLLRTSDLLDYKQAYTVMLRVYVSTDTNDFTVIYSVNDGLFFQNYEYVGFGGDGLTWRIASKHANGTEITASGGTATPETWYHIALVRSAANGTLTLFVDGVQECQLTNDVSTAGGALERMEIGAISQSDFSRFDGRGTEGLAYTAALNSSEIAAQMASSTAVRTADLWGDWPLQGASDLADISGNGRDWSSAGTLTTEDGPVTSSTYDQSLAGSTSATGDTIRLTTRSTSGTTTAAGALATMRALLASVAGSTSASGALLRRSDKALVGSTSAAGALLAARTALKSISGALQPAGALLRRSNKALAGALQPAGTLARHITRALAGVIYAAGAIIGYDGKARPILTATIEIAPQASVTCDVLTVGAVALTIEPVV